MLEIENLAIAYGGVAAVRSVSLTVAAKETVAIIGANGAGKSSTLRAIMGLVRPGGGSITFEGERIDGMRPADIVARGIALSPEGRRVFPHMSVRENLLTGAYLQKGRARTGATLDFVFAHFPRLVERRQQQAGSLSGGEQQMLAIGRALMAQPKLLLLDEPSLGLAPLMVQEIRRVVLEIREHAAVAVALVEQNAELALKLCNRAYVLERGQIVLAGNGAELLRNPGVRQAYLGL